MQVQKQKDHLATYKVFINAEDQLGGKLVIDKKGIILLSNDHNLNFSAKAGDPLFSILPKEILDLSSKKLEQIIKSNKGISVDLNNNVNGIDHWYQVSVNAINSDPADPLFMIQFINITRFKEIEKESNKQQKRIEEEMLLRTQEIIQTDIFTAENGGFFTNFMRGLRHDLLSPLAQLKEIIAYYKKADDLKKKERAAGLIDECLQKLDNTTQGFSDFVDLHILPQKGMKQVQISALFDDTKSLLINQITESNAQIICDFSRGSSVHFNEKIMSSILYNLLSNSIKFKRDDISPIIKIQTYTENGNFIFSIQDNGIGIDTEKYGHLLFKPFKRLNMDRPGAGVGLSMIKNILARHQGDIQIDSEPNIGTSVIVSIPILTKTVD